VAVSGAVAEKTMATGETRTVAVDRHQTAAVTPEDTQTAGQIKTTRADKDEFGRFTNTTETRAAVAVADAEVTKEVRDDETIERDLDRNQAAAGTPPSGHTDGQIDAVTSRKNEFGKFDVETVVRTAVAVSAAGAEKTITLGETRTVATDRHQESAVTPEDTQTAGQIKTTRADKDEFGRFTNITETRLAAAVADAEASKEVRGDEIIQRDLDRNQAAAGTPPTFTAGRIDAVTSRKNEFGKFDVETAVRTASAQNIEAYAHARDQNGTSTLEIFRNASSPPTLGTDYGEVKYVLNEFGLYDGHKIVVTNSTYSAWSPRTGITEVEVQSRIKPSDTTKDQYRTITYTFNIGYAASQESAYGYMTGGLSGSGVSRVEKNVWMYKKVTDIDASAWVDSSDGAWSV
jgi:hypothetical protein